MTMCSWINSVEVHLSNSGYQIDKALPADARIPELFKKMTQLIQESENIEVLQECSNLLVHIPKEESSSEIRNVVIEALQLEHLSHFTGPIVKITLKEAQRFGKNFFSAKLSFENKQVAYISLHEICHFAGLEDNLEMAEKLLLEILNSIKEDSPPDFRRFFAEIDKEDFSDVIRMVFHLVDYLSLELFQMEYMEPFNVKFPEIPLNEAPRTIKSLDCRKMTSTQVNNLPQTIKLDIESLCLSFRSVTGIDLSDFVGLKNLSLDYATGPVDVLIKNLSQEVKLNLKKLSLQGVVITGIDLSDFVGLKNLNLSYTIGPIDALIRNLSQEVKQKLKYLGLWKIDVTGIDLSDFVDLEELGLADAKGLVVAFINSLSQEVKGNLKSLCLDGIDVTGINLSDFTNLKGLELTDSKGPVGVLLNCLSLTVKRDIKFLDLNRINVTGIELMDFTGLDILMLNGAKGPVVAFINGLSQEVKGNLKILSLRGQDVAEIDLSDFKELKMPIQ